MATRYSTLHHEMKALAKAQGYKVFMKDIRLTRANEDWNADHTSLFFSRVEFTDAASGAEFVATRESEDAPWKLAERRDMASSNQPQPESVAMFPDYVYQDGGLVIRIQEGDGSNLTAEDEENGYCDYLMYYVYEDREALEAGDDFDGGMLLLDKLAHEQFSTLADAVPLVNGMVFI